LAALKEFQRIQHGVTPFSLAEPSSKLVGGETATPHIVVEWQSGMLTHDGLRTRTTSGWPTAHPEFVLASLNGKSQL